MTVKLYAFTCGTVTGEFAHLMEGGEGDITVPIPVFLIEHPKGRVLFDTGLHPDCQHDPAGQLGPRLAGLFRIGFQPGEEVSARLETIDRDPGKIDLIINSHFHFDHVGGNALIPNATTLVQRREWDAGMDPDIAAKRGFNPRDFDLGHKLRLVDGEHDVFGDGSVVCLPTFGHTPGSGELGGSRHRQDTQSTCPSSPVPRYKHHPDYDIGNRLRGRMNAVLQIRSAPSTSQGHPEQKDSYRIAVCRRSDFPGGDHQRHF